MRALSVHGEVGQPLMQRRKARRLVVERARRSTAPAPQHWPRWSTGSETSVPSIIASVPTLFMDNIWQSPGFVATTCRHGKPQSRNPVRTNERLDNVLQPISSEFDLIARQILHPGNVVRMVGCRERLAGGMQSKGSATAAAQHSGRQELLQPRGALGDASLEHADGGVRSGRDAMRLAPRQLRLSTSEYQARSATRLPIYSRFRSTRGSVKPRCRKSQGASILRATSNEPARPRRRISRSGRQPLRCRSRP